MRAFCWISSAKVCLKGLQKPLSFIFPPNRALGPASGGTFKININYINGLLWWRSLSQKLCKTVMFVVLTGCELPPIHGFMTTPGAVFDRYQLAGKFSVPGRPFRPHRISPAGRRW